MQGSLSIKNKILLPSFDDQALCFLLENKPLTLKFKEIRTIKGYSLYALMPLLSMLFLYFVRILYSLHDKGVSIEVT